MAIIGRLSRLSFMISSQRHERQLNQDQHHQQETVENDYTVVFNAKSQGAPMVLWERVGNAFAMEEDVDVP